MSRTERKLATEVASASSLHDLQQVLNLESLAFGGQGEDIYSLAMIAKVGWIIPLTQPGTTLYKGAIELVPTKNREVGFIHGVVVEPNAQSNGAGVKLIELAEQTASEAGMTQLEATIAPTNGASLNAFLNKSGYTATHFYPNFYGEGEHRFWVTKNIKEDESTFDEENWRELYATQMYPQQHLLVEDNNYEVLEDLINSKGYHVIGLVRPEKSGHAQNLLYLVQQSAEEVTLAQ